MTDHLWILCATAASIGVVHTALGPDHYVPFVAMARAGGWSRGKTALITLACGIGHVGSSVVLGVVGIGLGVALFHLQSVESMRAGLAAWLMLAFGLVYFVWGLRRGWRDRPHAHAHAHADGTVHSHEHGHHAAHVHAHADPAHPSLTPWVLFTIFVFGPCEPLIPLLMYPAAAGDFGQIIVVTTVFGAATLATMTAIVMAADAIGSRVSLASLGHYNHAAAGLAIIMCGAAMRLGW